VTLNPSDNIAFANSLASLSSRNDIVFLEDGARDEQGRHWLPLSIVTYQR
jgi:hypothetical protein